MYKNQKFRQILFITLLAFLLNAILPFFAIYNLNDNKAQAAGISSLFGEKILICTVDGFKWVSVKDLQNGKAPEHNSKYKCALCYVANKSDKDFILSGLILDFIQPYGVAYKFPPESHYPPLQILIQTANPRAPPYLT